MKLRSKVVEVEGVWWDGSNVREVTEFMHGSQEAAIKNSPHKWDDYVDIIRRDGLTIQTWEGPLHASIGDCIIKGLKGEFYPCKPDVIAMKYDVVG